MLRDSENVTWNRDRGREWWRVRMCIRRASADTRLNADRAAQLSASHPRLSAYRTISVRVRSASFSVMRAL